MDIVRPDAIPAMAKPEAGGAADVAGEGRSFDRVMADLDASKAQPQPAQVEGPGRPRDARALELVAEKTEIAESPGGIERLGREIETNSVRLRELIDQLQSGQTFTTQELIGMQAEMHEITVQIEVTTKVVSETISGVKQLAQQQG